MPKKKIKKREKKNKQNGKRGNYTRHRSCANDFFFLFQSHSTPRTRTRAHLGVHLIFLFFFINAQKRLLYIGGCVSHYSANFKKQKKEKKPVCFFFYRLSFLPSSTIMRIPRRPEPKKKNKVTKKNNKESEPTQPLAHLPDSLTYGVLVLPVSYKGIAGPPAGGCLPI